MKDSTRRKAANKKSSRFRDQVIDMMISFGDKADKARAFALKKKPRSKSRSEALLACRIWALAEARCVYVLTGKHKMPDYKRSIECPF